MYDFMKDHGHHVVQSMFDTKTTIATVVTTGSAVTVASVESSAQLLTLNDISVLAAIFAASATGIVMILNAIQKVLEIRRELRRKED